jgi:hypothetical protein
VTPMIVAEIAAHLACDGLLALSGPFYQTWTEKPLESLLGAFLNDLESPRAYPATKCNSPARSSASVFQLSESSCDPSPAPNKVALAGLLPLLAVILWGRRGIFAPRPEYHSPRSPHATGILSIDNQPALLLARRPSQVEGGLQWRVGPGIKGLGVPTGGRLATQKSGPGAPNLAATSPQVSHCYPLMRERGWVGME